jgi:CRISPR-associated protein Cmr2
VSDRVLHFTLGPVQSFVAEARRTRDLWAGSFLLSWLSAQAMRAIERHGAGNTVIFPEVSSDDLMRALRDGVGTPFIGSIPNRFKARVAPDFDPHVCVAAVQQAWRRLADNVWAEFVAGVAAEGRDTQAIWDRQVAHIWDMAWVAGPAPPDRSDGAWLDRRKTWRSHFPSFGDAPSAPRYQEAGDHCSLMGLFQELSGYIRSDPAQQPKQKNFWEKLAAQRSVGTLNIRANERLCAIALIKRLFPVLPDDCVVASIGWRPGGRDFPIKSWPSVSYLAAVPWISQAWSIAPAACRDFHTTVRQHTNGSIHGETATRIIPAVPWNEGFFKLDGQFFHEDAVRSMKADIFNDSEGNRATVLEALGKLNGAIRDSFLLRRQPSSDAAAKALPRWPFKASEFYAVVKMDGDSIGRHLREEGGEQSAMRGLAAFTSKVPGIVADNRGVTIYAGGDDVLAIFPLDDALPAVIQLREAYRQSFALQTGWTTSAAIVFAQYHIPLRAVLRQADRQLDEIAKRKNGRDSLALCVLKPGGVAIEWVSAWSGASESELPSRLLHEFAKRLQLDRDVTASFLHNLRERYQPLFGDDEAFSADRSDLDLLKHVVRAEYVKCGGPGDAAVIADSIVRIGTTWTHRNTKTASDSRFNFDAGLGLRFMVEEGRWFLAQAPEVEAS